jgi:diguanylate cyclase (GGDEF)-like protein
VSIAVLLVVVGMVGAVNGADSVATGDAQTAREGFEQTGEQIASTLGLSIEREQDLVINASAYALANPGSSNSDFVAWANSVQALERYPEIQGVGEAVIVPAAELPAFARRIEADPPHPLGPTGKLVIVPAGARPFYCLGTTSLNRGTEGLPAGIDYCALGSSALDSRDSGLSNFAPFPIGKPVWLAATTPMYRGGGVPATVQGRRAAFAGWVGVVADPQVVLDRALYGRVHTDVALDYHRGSSDTVFQSGTPPDGAARVTVALDRGWTVDVFRVLPPSGVLSNPNSRTALLGGLAMSVIVGALVLVLGTGRARAFRLLRQVQAQAERLGQLADTDYVTGLANPRRFADRLGEALAGDPERLGGLLLIDLERFAEINDTLGHRAGEAILRAFGERLGDTSGEGALVARLGEDAFAVLDPSITSGEEACAAAERIRCALQRPLELPSMRVSVEVVVGVVLLPEDATEPELALSRAEIALSAARTRPGRTARYGAEMETGGGLAPLLIGELGTALEDGDIVLHYQPQVDIGSGLVFGVEALARWQHPRRGMLGPDSFIAAAEQTGLIGPFTQYVLDHALRQCAHWRSEGLELTVAVNLSARNLLDLGLVDDVRAALDRHGLDAEALELEITESSAMVDPRRSMQVLGKLAEMGVMLSVDDFGTGHSSLAYLQRLPVRRLKIDRSFVTGLIGDDASTAIVHSTIELARALGLDVIAEGVEDDATLLRLSDMRCFAAQGFGLGRPVAGPLLPELIRRIEARLPLVLAATPAGRART